VTADLPAPRHRPAPPKYGHGFAPDAGGTAMRVLTTIWLSAALVNLLIWGMLVLTLGHWLHPWWLWVAVPPGAVLGTLYFLGIGRRRL
ncbi:MAG TPA: hypothetical protein VFR35_02600, partial [Actinoplanes sp.]|nr:hypothetical protein [Actinoplanes sp.]